MAPKRCDLGRGKQPATPPTPPHLLDAEEFGIDIDPIVFFSTPGEHFAERPIARATPFNTHYFEGESSQQGSMAFLWKAGALVLLTLLSTIMYPRLVRVFFENLKVEETGLWGDTLPSAHTFIDGYRIGITHDLIAHVYNLPTEPPEGLLPPQKHPNIEIIANALTGGEVAKGHSILRSSLPDE